MVEFQKQFLNLNQPSKAGSRVIGQMGLTLVLVAFSWIFLMENFHFCMY